MEILQAQTDRQFEQGKQLFKEYADSLQIDLSYQSFEKELQSLQTMYAPPKGILLLATYEQEIMGCVGVRALPNVGEKACEMKRLFIRPSYRGSGLGRTLAEEVLNGAKELGYKQIYLDTLQQMKKAISLYKSLGFKKVEEYYDNPRNDAYYLAMELLVTEKSNRQEKIRDKLEPVKVPNLLKDLNYQISFLKKEYRAFVNAKRQLFSKPCFRIITFKLLFVNNPG
jgi:ribosomal protein S18 acetylase RimI-like enzyme